MSEDQGIFLTIEGGEGVGKSTALKYIERYLIAAKCDFVLTREPGGTEVAEEIRKILLSTNLQEPITPTSELLLMFACRSQHLANVILPALQRGMWVVSDRFIDASYAYQGGGRQLDMDKIKVLDEWVVEELKPDVTILLDAPPEIGLARTKHRGQQDRIEQEEIEFFERVRSTYLRRAKLEPKRFCIIDATQPLPVVEKQLEKILNELNSK